MVVPAHLGFEHPNLLWLVLVGIGAFVIGLGVNLYRSRRESAEPTPTDERQPEEY